MAQMLHVTVRNNPLSGYVLSNVYETAPYCIPINVKEQIISIFCKVLLFLTQCSCKEREGNLKYHNFTW